MNGNYALLGRSLRFQSASRGCPRKDQPIDELHGVPYGFQGLNYILRPVLHEMQLLPLLMLALPPVGIRVEVVDVEHQVGHWSRKRLTGKNPLLVAGHGLGSCNHRQALHHQVVVRREHAVLGVGVQDGSSHNASPHRNPTSSSTRPTSTTSTTSTTSASRATSTTVLVVLVALVVLVLLVPLVLPAVALLLVLLVLPALLVRNYTHTRQPFALYAQDRSNQAD